MGHKSIKVLHSVVLELKSFKVLHTLETEESIIVLDWDGREERHVLGLYRVGTEGAAFARGTSDDTKKTTT